MFKAGNAIFKVSYIQASNPIYPKTARLRKLAPPFEAMSWWSGFKKFKLSDHAGKYVVLIFWPWDFSPVSTTEIVQYSTKASDFKALNCQLVGVSCDSHFSHREWSQRSKRDLDFPLVADLDHSIARKYGCYLEGDD